ncbi:tripartite tricarboxylate transporter TctB family protein [Microvirga makkahensis]|uniref:DUF1468 domain-containing protein n=1 Tax=Microvirga makkahensis TaxID=1128670 RepID=A0A7X3SRG4_9HYPH|nr:tripartite tricarboxylate transporter TctB family protein [Microvirga makkahensis]MXQ14345.1 hypothetical protein [Microvirga makkahensis]
MRIGNRTYKVDWGHFLVATSIAAFSIAYLLDARATSLNIQNLLLVQPTALFVLLMYLLVLRQCISVAEGALVPSRSPEPDERAARDEERKGLGRIAALIAVFGVFAFTVEDIGYDVAGWVFTVVGLWICGERRIWVLAIFPAIFAIIVVLGFKMMVPYPMTTLFL